MLKKTFKYGRLIFGTLFAIVLAYILYQVINAFGSSPKTVRASIETAGVTVSGNVLLVRDEVLLPSINAENYSLTLEDGEKIASGGTYARVYSSGSVLEAYDEDVTNRKITSRLTQVESTLDDRYDIADLNRSITSSLASLPRAGEAAEEASALKDELSLFLLKRRYAMEPEADLSNTLNYYAMLTANYEESASVTQLVADASGYYSSYADGYESTLTLEKAPSLTREYVEYCISHETDFTSDLTSSPGKVITNFRWEFLMPVEKEESELLRTKKRYEVDMQGERIRATLESIRGDDENGYLLEFSTDANISHFASLRTTSASVIVEEYSGYRVPLDALRIVNDKVGVYVLQGYAARFIEVEVLWKGDTYYIVEADLKSEDGLFTNDYIIINTKGLKKEYEIITNDPISN